MDKNEIKFVVEGKPVGKGRPRFASTGTNGFSKAYTPADTEEYEQKVKLLYKVRCRNYRFPKDLPLDVRIKAYFPIPKHETKSKKLQMLAFKLRPTVKPDLDNICKIILDALNKVAFYDDSDIVDLQIRKFYSDNPRVEITIKEAAEIK